ncbi:sigma factor-like helix-turn-helix DNA-binding protein [Actinoplanes sp. NPDC051470]|uniref:sigma factor-like helix-turn-helix DNA-binding protein n=1 Tax=unclassified Actinoplanes TaxID=2626549 RepID=UPI00343AAEDD
MAGDNDEGLHDFVADRYRDLRRSAFLMCGDWGLAEEVTQAALARFVSDSARSAVEDPDAYVYADVMAAFQRKAPRREHLFVASPDATTGDTDPIRAVLVLAALHKLSPRCRAVIVLRQWDSFTVDETADILDLPDERVEAYEAAGLAALQDLLNPEAVPA